MCHILLLLPFLALPVFSFFPLSVSLPVYGAVVVLSAAVYWIAIRAMSQPVLNGAEGVIGSTCEVIDNRDGKLFVQIHSEIWRAVPVGPRPNRGDRLTVVGVENLTLRVQQDPERKIASRPPERSAAPRTGADQVLTLLDRASPRK